MHVGIFAYDDTGNPGVITGMGKTEATLLKRSRTIWVGISLLDGSAWQTQCPQLMDPDAVEAIRKDAEANGSQ